MSTLLFAVLDAAYARRGLVVFEHALAKAEKDYSKAEAAVERHQDSRNPQVRQRAADALRLALDAVDEARAKLESEKERSTELDAAEKNAYDNSQQLLNQESAQLQQHRNCHA